MALLKQATPLPWVSLNSACLQTNTLVRPGSGKCYDHVMVDPRHTTEAELDFSSFVVVDLREAMRPRWQSFFVDAPYPGEPTTYDHDRFRTRYSDHHPVRVTLKVPEIDDDGATVSPPAPPEEIPPPVLIGPPPPAMTKGREIQLIPAFDRNVGDAVCVSNPHRHQPDAALCGAGPRKRRLPLAGTGSTGERR